MYNKGKKCNEQYATIAPEPFKYDLSSTQDQLSHTSSRNDSYNLISPYINEPYLLYICFLDEDLENAQNENLVSWDQ